jgi:hypothetical protein
VFRANDRKYKIVLSCPRSWGQGFFLFLCILPIDKQNRLCANATAEISLYTTPTNLSIGKMHKLHSPRSPDFVISHNWLFRSAMVK